MMLLVLPSNIEKKFFDCVEKLPDQENNLKNMQLGRRVTSLALCISIQQNVIHQ